MGNGKLTYEELQEWNTKDLIEEILNSQDITEELKESIDFLTSELSGEREISETLRQRLISIGGDAF